MTDVSETGCSHMTPADGNIFEDLGFAPEDAALLLEASKVSISNKESKPSEPSVPKLKNIK